MPEIDQPTTGDITPSLFMTSRSQPAFTCVGGVGGYKVDTKLRSHARGWDGTHWYNNVGRGVPPLSFGVIHLPFLVTDRSLPHDARSPQENPGNTGCQSDH